MLVVWIQLLFCGLFITAHDACHGSVAPGAPRLNRRIGQVAAWLYAGLSFDTLAQAHRLHHQSPGTADDPDFAGPGRHGRRCLVWAARFARRYVTMRQLLTQTLVAQVLIHGCHLPPARVLSFWALPACLSAAQLFVFGTYLPHRPKADETFADRHRARHSGYSRAVSFVSCYHFGYHHMHHCRPHLPWYALPAACADANTPRGVTAKTR
jgi:beta-carotene ketolase (CrtW type)